MRKFALPVVFLFAWCGVARAQVAQPTATPPADSGEVVKISTSLIQLDLTVTNKSGQIVTDLRPDEVEIYENGQKQPITNFKFISNMRTREELERRTTSQTVVVAPPSTAPRPELTHRTIAIVIDDLNLSYESTTFVKTALKKFVNEQMQEGDLVALVRTGTGIGALQQFTNDKRQLHAAIDKLKWNPLGSGTGSTNEQLVPKYEARFGGRPPTPGERTLAGLKREFEDTRKSVYAQGTLGAVNFVVTGMKDLPGRKSIMLLSDGFRLYSEDAQGFKESAKVLESLRRLVDAANRASVVIYTVEARGLEVNGLDAADGTNGWTRQEINVEVADRRNKINDTQEGLGYLAQQTGGTAVTNNSDLASGIRKILDNQSYYIVGYEPDGETFDPKARRFNTIEIKVNRPDTFARYRSGFFAVSDSPKSAQPQTAGERLSTALTSPFGVNDISLKLNALFYNSPRGAVIRSLVHVRAQDMKFSDETDGRKKVVFDVVAVGFGENGMAVDKKSTTQTMVLKKDVADEVMRNGFVYDFLFPVKKAGGYQLRIAFRDHGSDRLGSASQFVEVPDLKQDQLVLSGTVLENIDFADWQRQRKNQPALTKSDPLRDTSLRQFKRGSVLNYGFSIYNAKLVGGKPNLTYQTSIFRNGKLLFGGRNQPIAVSDPNAVDFTSTISLGLEMEPGDYVLQVLVTDNASNSKSNVATQFVPFEIVD